MFKEKIKSLIKPQDGNNKKNIENAVVFIIILIVTIIIINTIWKEKPKKDEENIQNENLAESNVTDIQNTDIEKNIKQILSKISGVGKVEVLITYSETSQVVAMYNENYKESQTEEEDTNGGVRKIQETNKDKEVIYEEENGVKKPVTERVIMPKIEGALIVAEGANNSEVKTNIIQAVEALTGLSTHKIQVLEMKENV